MGEPLAVGPEVSRRGGVTVVDARAVRAGRGQFEVAALGFGYPLLFSIPAVWWKVQGWL